MDKNANELAGLSEEDYQKYYAEYNAMMQDIYEKDLADKKGMINPYTKNVINDMNDYIHFLQDSYKADFEKFKGMNNPFNGQPINTVEEFIQCVDFSAFIKYVKEHVNKQ